MNLITNSKSTTRWRKKWWFSPKEIESGYQFGDRTQGIFSFQANFRCASVALITCWVCNLSLSSTLKKDLKALSGLAGASIGLLFKEQHFEERPATFNWDSSSSFCCNRSRNFKLKLLLSEFRSSLQLSAAMNALVFCLLNACQLIFIVKKLF